MTIGKRNLRAGPAYEKEIVDEFNAHQLFPTLFRSQEINKKADKNKNDIVAQNVNDFEFSIQAKSTTNKVPYYKLIDELKENYPFHTPLVFHKYNKRVKDRYITKDRYVILRQEDFIKILVDKKKYEQAYLELMTYWDTFTDSQQKVLDEFLNNVGL